MADEPDQTGHGAENKARQACSESIPYRDFRRPVPSRTDRNSKLPSAEGTGAVVEGYHRSAC